MPDHDITVSTPTDVERMPMATEKTPGAENSLESLAKVVAQCRPIEERLDPRFTDRDPAEGKAVAASPGTGQD
jgi:hypothetical protein